MDQQHKPYKIGVALSGGGIKGLCHAGALKALEEANIRPDLISGVSAGAIVGALYADGYTPEEIAEFFRNITFRDMTKIKLTEGGLFRIDDFENFLSKMLRTTRIEDLSIPMKIVATDLDKGKCVTFTRGDLVERVIASCTVPVLFTPKKIGDCHYVDGGVIKNLPASTIREDCDILIGINASPMVAPEYKMGILAVAMRSYHFMLKSNVIHDKELCDLLIEPTDMGNYDTFSVDKSMEIFEIGYLSTKRIIENNDVFSRIS